MKTTKENITVKYNYYQLNVEYYYTPEETRTFAYPGAPAEIEVDKVMIKDVDVTDLFEQIENGFKTIEDLIFEKL